MYYKTNRSFTDIESKEVFKLWMNSVNHSFKLISDGSEKLANGSEVNGFYISANTGGVTIKLNNKKQVFIPDGSFYNIKEGEKVTHKKYIGFKRFTKV